MAAGKSKMFKSNVTFWKCREIDINASFVYNCLGSRSEDDDDLGPNHYSSHKKRPGHHRGSSNHYSSAGGNGNMKDDDDNPRRAYSPVAETLFRKDLISAMKLPDNEPLTEEDYWLVTVRKFRF